VFLILFTYNMESIRKKIKESFKKLIQENNYPAGAEFRSDAPWNQKDDEYSEPEGLNSPFVGIYTNPEMSILRDTRDNTLWYYYDGHINRNDLYQLYASVNQRTNEFDIDSDVVARYVNTNLDKLTKGIGIEGQEEGFDLVKIDRALASELRALYKDEKLNNILLALT